MPASNDAEGGLETQAPIRCKRLAYGRRDLQRVERKNPTEGALLAVWSVCPAQTTRHVSSTSMAKVAKALFSQVFVFTVGKWRSETYTWSLVLDQKVV